MKQGHSFFSRKSIWLVLISSLSCLLLGIIALIWLVGIIFPKEISAPEAFPNNEIVFVAVSGVGFVNADGSNPQYVDFVVKEYGNNSDFWRPVMGADNHILIVKVVPSEHYIYNPHSLTIWRSGALPVLCKQWGEQQMPLLSADQSHIFIRTDQGMMLYALESCGTDDVPMKIYKNITGILSPNLKYIVYSNRPSADPGNDRFIVIRDLTSGKEQTVGIGDYPTWSRNSQWLAFTGRDGIYVFNILRDVEPRRVILYKNPYPYHESSPLYEGGDYARIPPEVSWSPDGKWIVYHKWMGTDTDTGVNPHFNAIYKLNIETGDEIKIIDGGMYPYWRWPIESQQ